MKHVVMMSFLLTPLFMGCAGLGEQTRGEELPKAETAFAAQFVDLNTGDSLSRERAFEWLGEHRHIYVGEHHGDPLSHRVQLEVLDGLLRLFI